METFSKDVKPKELEQVLRLEYRSKLLNPKWAQVCHPSLPVALEQCVPNSAAESREEDKKEEQSDGRVFEG